MLCATSWDAARVPAPPPSARASLKRAHALWMPAHVSCAIANRRVKVCWHRWKSAACVRWLVALLRHWCSSVYVFGRACRLYTSVARRATVGKRGPDTVAVRSCFFRSETRSRHLTHTLPSGIHDALYREGVGDGGGWPLRVNVRGNNRRESVEYYNRFMNTELNTGVPVEFRVEPVAKPKGSMGFSPAGCPNASLKWLPHAGHSF